MNDRSVTTISRELDFVARNTDEIWDLLEDPSTETTVKALINDVVRAAEKNLRQLLPRLARTINPLVKGWTTDWRPRVSMSEWTHRGRIWSDARKRRLADIGVTVIEGSKGPRLVAWMRPRGELAGRQYLARVCRAKIDNVMLASEDELQYPGWTQVEDAVVWIDRDLKPTTDLNVLVDETAVRSKEFYKAARVAVEKLAAGL